MSITFPSRMNTDQHYFIDVQNKEINKKVKHKYPQKENVSKETLIRKKNYCCKICDVAFGDKNTWQQFPF